MDANEWKFINFINNDSMHNPFSIIKNIFFPISMISSSIYEFVQQ